MPEIASNAVWQIFPSRHGILLKGDATPCAGSTSSRLNTGNDSPRIQYLQRNDSSIEGNLEPALPLSLADDEILELQDVRLAAATHYGPAGQDKASNEDFALSAVIQAQGREFAFAAVADGVSTRTFWSARAARIACIGAYKGIRECLLGGIDPGDESKHGDIARQVAAVIDRALSDDRIALDSSSLVPIGWDKAIYDKYKGDSSAWHRSTLLFGVIGNNGGMIAMTGDGGVRGLLVENAKAREPNELRVMCSESGKDLASYVTHGFSNKDIQLLPLRSRDRLATHVVFASDGLDLTLQQYVPNEVHDKGRHCRSRYRDLPLDDGQTALSFLETLSETPRTVADNLSVARLTWPLPKEKTKWARWKTEKFGRWKLSKLDAEKLKSGTQHAAAESGWKRLLPANSAQWTIPTLIGLTVGCAVTLASIAAIVGFENLRADLSPVAKAASKPTTTEQSAAPSASSEKVGGVELQEKDIQSHSLKKSDELVSSRANGLLERINGIFVRWFTR